tara:strand:- start:176 stop:670 length:495 start_codon:yes stop_codon:yes gene_type:complete
MTKTLIIMRHAKSSWDDSGLADYERPLNQRGLRDASRMAQWLSDSELIPDQVIASAACRASQTASIVTNELALKADILETRDLYLSDYDAYLEQISYLPNDVETVLVIGHNPTMESLVYLLSGDSISMPTAAIAVIQLPIDIWSDQVTSASANLVKHVFPKSLG